MGALRVLLAFAVLVGHATPPFGWHWLTMTEGALSVQIFYVISGFYMALILHERYVGQGATVAFLKNRLLRLYPMFAAVVALSAASYATLWLALHREVDPIHYWRSYAGRSDVWAWVLVAASNLTIIGQDVMNFVGVDPLTSSLHWSTAPNKDLIAGWRFLFVPAWTVGLELMFYTIAPFVVRWKRSAIALLIAASLALRVVIMQGLQLNQDPWTYRFFPTELALFLAGSLAYRLYRRGRATRIDWLVTVATLGLVVGYQRLPAAVRHPWNGLAPILAVIPIALPFVFRATRETKLDRKLSELSYPLYLVHYPILFIVWAMGWSYWLSIFGSLLTAYLLWRWVGLPMEGRRARIATRYRMAQPPG